MDVVHIHMCGMYKHVHMRMCIQACERAYMCGGTCMSICVYACRDVCVCSACAYMHGPSF